MRQTPPPAKSQRSRLLIVLVCALISVALIGPSYFLNNIADTIYQASLKPIPTGTPDDPDPNAPVTCNGVPMSPSDKCEHTLIINGQAGLPADFTYEEQKQFQKQSRLEQVVMQREKLQQDQQSKPFWYESLGCLTLPLFLLGVCASIVTLVMLWRWFAQFFKRRQT